MNEPEISEELIEEIAQDLMDVVYQWGWEDGQVNKPGGVFTKALVRQLVFKHITRILSAVRDDKQKLPGERKQRWGIGTIKVLYAQNGSHDLTNSEVIILEPEEASDE